MPTDLPRLIPDPGQRVPVQDTDFTLDVLGRYICNTWDEAVNNGGVAFDAVVIGAGMFGAYCAEKIYRHANVRVLVLDAGCLLVTAADESRFGTVATGGQGLSAKPGWQRLRPRPNHSSRRCLLRNGKRNRGGADDRLHLRPALRRVEEKIRRPEKPSGFGGCD